MRTLEIENKTDEEKIKLEEYKQKEEKKKKKIKEKTITKSALHITNLERMADQRKNLMMMD